MNRSEFLKVMFGGALGMALVGKTEVEAASTVSIDCFGDSTTWGADGIGKGDGPKVGWPQALSKVLNVKDVVNVGKKGSRIAVTSDRKDSFVERVSKVRKTANLVIVFGGVNDFNNSVPLGKIGNGDTRTFCGALEHVLVTLVKDNPAREIVVMTPAKTWYKHATKNYPNSFQQNGQGLIQEDYAKAMREVAHHYSIPVIDLFNESGISPFIEEQASLYMPDRLHYTPEAYERLARRIAAGLKSVCGCLQ